MDLIADHISHRFGALDVLDHVSFAVASGEVVAIVGPSGCGKSTLLRLIAGLETATAGSIGFGEQARAEDIRVMFQEPRLLPWARVLSNVEVGLGRERASADAQARAERGHRRAARRAAGQQPQSTDLCVPGFCTAALVYGGIERRISAGSYRAEHKRAPRRDR
jgi:ABC-type nitrate/sulfonate/bicarbonate transport system ATPase subunit